MNLTIFPTLPGMEPDTLTKEEDYASRLRITLEVYQEIAVRLMMALKDGAWTDEEINELITAQASEIRRRSVELVGEVAR